MSDQRRRGIDPDIQASPGDAQGGAEGDQIGAFRIVAKLGEGGMGVVYLAEDERLHRRVALKVLSRSDDQARRQRFLREARAAAAVTHPNIATIHEVGEADGVSFIAMELVRGRTLRDVLIGTRERRELSSVAEIVRIGGEVARGLAGAHKAGIIHRDLKPENVMMSDDNRIILLDFGIAKRLSIEDPGATSRAGNLAEPAGNLAEPADVATIAGSILGTPGYMSPEQSSGSPVDCRTDVFAFGVMLYELLTGERPFTGATLLAVLVATQCKRVAPPSQKRPDTPPELERIVLRCLEKSPEARYRDGAELTDDLDRLAQALPSVGARLPLSRDGLLRRGMVFTALHFSILIRIVGLGTAPWLALVVARYVILRLLQASAANVAQVVLGGVLQISAVFVLASTSSAITACTAWLLVNPARNVRARDAFAALRGKLGSFTGSVLMIYAVVLAILGAISLIVGLLLTSFGHTHSADTLLVLLSLNPGMTLGLIIVASAMAAPVTTRWCLAFAVLALERRGPIATLRRSSEIVRRLPRSAVLLWLTYILLCVMPAALIQIIVGSVMNSPIASFEVFVKGDIANTIGLFASCAVSGVLLLPLTVGGALGYLHARQAEGETHRGHRQDGSSDDEGRGDVPSALTTLDERARRHPRGQLAKERETLR